MKNDNVKIEKNQPQERSCRPDQRQSPKMDFDFDSLYRTLKQVDTDLFFELLTENYSAG